MKGNRQIKHKRFLIDVVFRKEKVFKSKIDTFRGQYTSDPFLAKIIKYLQIEENKVAALDNYRKIKK